MKGELKSLSQYQLPQQDADESNPDDQTAVSTRQKCADSAEHGHLRKRADSSLQRKNVVAREPCRLTKKRRIANTFVDWQSQHEFSFSFDSSMPGSQNFDASISVTIAIRAFGFSKWNRDSQPGKCCGIGCLVVVLKQSVCERADHDQEDETEDRVA